MCPAGDVGGSAGPDDGEPPGAQSCHPRSAGDHRRTPSRGLWEDCRTRGLKRGPEEVSPRSQTPTSLPKDPTGPDLTVYGPGLNCGVGARRDGGGVGVEAPRPRLRRWVSSSGPVCGEKECRGPGWVLSWTVVTHDTTDVLPGPSGSDRSQRYPCPGLNGPTTTSHLWSSDSPPTDPPPHGPSVGVRIHYGTDRHDKPPGEFTGFGVWELTGLWGLPRREVKVGSVLRCRRSV